MRFEIGVFPKSRGHFARFEQGVFFAAVATAGRFDKPRVDYHVLHGKRQTVLLLQVLKKGVEKALEDPGVDERLPEVTVDLPVGHGGARRQGRGRRESICGR